MMVSPRNRPPPISSRHGDEHAGLEIDGGPVEVFGVAGGIGIVLEEDRHGELALQLRHDRRVFHPGDIGGEDHGSCP